MKYIMLLLFVLTFIQVRSQAIEEDTIEWTSNSLTDLSTNDEMVYHGTFVTFRNEKVEWVQGDYVIIMPVKTTVGNWTDVGKDGVITYQVKINDRNGTITFRRDSGLVTVRTEFVRESRNELPYEFAIGQINRIEP